MESSAAYLGVVDVSLVLQGLFVSISEAAFRSDISSTQLRKELEASKKQ